MSIREAIARFRELHDEFKGGAFKSPEARAFYESERDDFLRALLQGQQLAVRPGQSPRQLLRVAAAVNVVLQLGPRREEGTTMDIGSGGFAAVLRSPLAARIVCDFELALPGEPVRGRARVVAASVRDAQSNYRTSFAVESLPDDDRSRLDTAVVDIALAAAPKR
jgi:hypothetical protein